MQFYSDVGSVLLAFIGVPVVMLALWFLFWGFGYAIYALVKPVEWWADFKYRFLPRRRFKK